MDIGATSFDYTIFLEETVCPQLIMVSNRLSCMPPKQRPAIVQTGAFEKGKLRVKVRKQAKTSKYVKNT